jgi:hypothetical protein
MLRVSLLWHGAIDRRVVYNARLLRSRRRSQPGDGFRFLGQGTCAPSQYGRIAEVARGGIASATERDRACMAQHFPMTVRTLYRGHRLGHSIGSPTTTLPSATSNGNATKYVIPAMAHLTLFGCFSARSEGVWPVSKYLKQET